ncbi:MAG: hypothetical protein ABR521_02010 [Gaiellaceae bacterium]
MTDAELPDGPFEVVVSVDEQHRDALHDVASKLQDAGLEGAVVLAEAGVVTGGVPHAEAFQALKGVAGVEAAEVSRDIQLPPPDDPVQ